MKSVFFIKVSSSNLGPPSNSGLQGPPFQPVNITYGPLKQSLWRDGLGTLLSWINQTVNSKMQVTGKISDNKKD